MTAATDTDPFAGLRDGFTPHPPTAMQRYRDAGLFADRALWQLIERAARQTPDRPAVTDASTSCPQTLTYAQLGRAMNARAAGFVAAGLRPGQRVILQQHNSAQFAITLLGLLRAGLVPVMALPAHRVAEIAHLAAGAGAVAYLAEDATRGFDYRELGQELIRRVPGVAHVFVTGETGDGSAAAPMPDADPAGVDLPGPVDPDLPALLLVSGGTTGLPKLIARTHNDYTLNAQLSAGVAGLTGDDVYLAALPAAHNFALCCPGIFGIWSAGGHAVFLDNPSPDAAFDIIAAHRVTVTALVPALAQVWCAATEWESADISSLRLLQVGGSKLARADAQALDAALGPIVQQVFGMAEGLICSTRLDDPRDLVHEVQGRPMSELDEVRIVDDNGTDVPDGDEGELLVRGPYTIRAYFRSGSERAASSFTADGFYRSGDRVRRLGSGHLVVTGRIKDTILRAGENVAADAVEEYLIAHPSIRQAAVIGAPDDSLSERICALVVPSAEHLPGHRLGLAEIREFLSGRDVAAFMLPDEVRTVSSLPLTAIGKVDKKALRAEIEAT